MNPPVVITNPIQYKGAVLNRLERNPKRVVHLPSGLEFAVVEINGQKLDLDYPRGWSYKIIGLDEQALRAAVALVMQDLPHKISFSKKSSGGKYVSLGIDVTVHSEEHRLLIFNAFKSSKAIRFVL